MRVFPAFRGGGLLHRLGECRRHESGVSVLMEQFCYFKPDTLTHVRRGRGVWGSRNRQEQNLSV